MEEKYELIEAFLAGELPAEDRIDFEKKLKSSPELQAEVELHGEMASAIGGQKFQAFREAVKQTDSEWNPPAKNNISRLPLSFSSPRQWLIAAAIVLLGVLSWFLLQPQETSPEALFAAHFKPYDMVLSQRSVDPTFSSELNLAIAHYSNDQFSEAEKHFLRLAEAHPDEPIYRMYACVSGLAQEKSEEAIACFKQLLHVENLREQAQWYLALAYLQQGDVEKAKAHLENIPEGAYQFEQAKGILGKL